MRLAAYVFGSSGASLGEGLTDECDGGVRYVDTCAEALALIASSPACEVVLGHRESLRLATSLRPPMSEVADLVHAGNLPSAPGGFATARLCSSSWLLLDPDQRRVSSAWKASCRGLWLRMEALRAIGGFDSAYASPAARVMDAGYRIVLAGGRVRQVPDWLVHCPSLDDGDGGAVSLADELLFIIRHFGARRAAYAALWTAGRHPARTAAAFVTAARRSRCPRPRPQGEWASRLAGPTPRCVVGNVSAIVPTLDRYEYLGKAIDSLLRQVPSPREIIVVDQTPRERRPPDFYRRFEGGIVRVVDLEVAGQSVARNSGLQAAISRWCLLFDDDSEAWPGMLQAHIAAVESTGASVSTGASLAPWKTLRDLSSGMARMRLADVLDTGNALVDREVVLAAGGLDRAFDRGSGADDELGRRLFLAGAEVVLNKDAVRTHHKAPRGGLRTHGAWWSNRTAPLSPYPAPTFIHMIHRYYPKSHLRPLLFLQLLTAGRRHSVPGCLWLWVSFVPRCLLSMKKASMLRSRYVQEG